MTKLAAISLLVACFLFPAYSYGQTPDLAKTADKQKPPTPSDRTRTAPDQKVSEAKQYGTDESPFTVKILPAEDAKGKAEREEQYKKEKANEDWWLTGATIALAIFTALLWGATYRLAKDAKATAAQQSTDTQTSLRIATANAEAVIKSFNLSREDHIATHRPKIVVRRLAARTVPPRNLLEVEFVAVNTGPGRARVVETAARLWLPENWPMAVPAIENSHVQTRTEIEASSGEEIRFTHPITEQQLVEEYHFRTTAGNAIIIFGYVLYIDNLDRRHRTGFFRQYNPTTSRFHPLDDPEYEYQD